MNNVQIWCSGIPGQGAGVYGWVGGWGCTIGVYNGVYGEAPPGRGTFFMVEVYKRVGISRFGVQKRIQKTFI